jgi:hypothetical protein
MLNTDTYNVLAENRDVESRLNNMLSEGGVEIFVVLRTGRPNSRTLGSVQHLELDP